MSDPVSGTCSPTCSDFSEPRQAHDPSSEPAQPEPSGFSEPRRPHDPSPEPRRPLVVDIVIPTFGQTGFTLKCLESLARNTEPEAARIVWVDNGSDGAHRRTVTAALETLGLPSRRILIDENLGFVKATNAGIAVSTAPYVCLLNNDTEVPPGWLVKLVEAMGVDKRVGLVGPRSSSPLQWQGQLDIPIDKAGVAVLGRHQMLSFFCCLIRRAVIEQCGYLSEEYRAGLGDDDDYCEVAKRKGWLLALRLDCLVTHHHRTTFREVYGEGGWLPYQEENLAHFKRKWGKG